MFHFHARNVGFWLIVRWKRDTTVEELKEELVNEALLIARDCPASSQWIPMIAERIWC